MREHNTGHTASIAKRAPFKVVYIEKFSSQKEAFSREKVIKRYKGGEAFKKLLEKE